MLGTLCVFVCVGKVLLCRHSQRMVIGSVFVGIKEKKINMFKVLYFSSVDVELMCVTVFVHESTKKMPFQ